MKRTSIVILMLLLCTIWALAQQDSSQTSKSGSSSQTTVDGCLSKSGSNYTLTDKSSGTTYQLTGDTSKLSDHVGHEVQITGTQSGGSSGASSSTSGSSSQSSSSGSQPSGSSSQQSLEVTSMKHISETCSSGSNSKSKSESQNPPMSEKPPL
jgi:hypothetical protein